VRPSEALMHRYYWAAKAVTQLQPDPAAQHRGAAQPLQPTARARSTPRFNDEAGMLDVASDDLYQREPHAILETFLVYQTHAWA
jgi:[protein-PII] uridylyltransferase